MAVPKSYKNDSGDDKNDIIYCMKKSNIVAHEWGYVRSTFELFVSTLYRYGMENALILAEGFQIHVLLFDSEMGNDRNNEIKM